jgi:hypothetical protein
MERARGGQDASCAIASPPSRTLAGWPPKRLFVTVREAWRYLATSAQTIGLYTVRKESNELRTLEE